MTREEEVALRKAKALELFRSRQRAAGHSVILAALSAAPGQHRPVMGDVIATIVGPQEIGGRIKTALGLVARRTGLPERRVRGLWHKEARAIRAEELDALRRAARAEQRAEINAEIAGLRARIACLEEQIAMAGPAMGRAPGHEVRDPMGGFRGMDREG